MTLTKKRRVFIEEYLKCWNASEAARRAKYAHPGSEGHRLLKNAEIVEAIQERIDALKMEADEILLRLADMARASMDDFMDIDSRGEPVPNLAKAKASGKLHLIKKLYFDKDGQLRQIELHDAQSALGLLGRHKPLFVERYEHTGAGGGPIVYLPAIQENPDV